MKNVIIKKISCILVIMGVKEMRNVIFLDYDGVVNSPQWRQDGNGEWKTYVNHITDGVVNDTQAVQWVSEFCKRYGYDIVVTSTWRLWDNYQDALIRAGLREGIKIDRTEDLSNSNNLFQTRGRGHEIADYLWSHSDIEEYLIFDDESWELINFNNLLEHLVFCKNGFYHWEFIEAQNLRHKLYATK